MQRETAANSAALRVASARSDVIRVDVLDATVSLAEVQRLLDAWFSRRTAVTTAISRVAGGLQDGALAMDVRIGDQPGARLVQPDGDLETLLGRAAEVIYRTAHPLRFVEWLDQHGRSEEAIALERQLALNGPPAQQAQARVRLSTLLQATLPRRERIALLEAATRLDPTNSPAWNNLAVALPVSERRYQTLLRSQRSGRRFPSGMTPTFISELNIASIKGDARETLKLDCALYEIEPCSTVTLAAEASDARWIRRGVDTTPGARLATIAMDLARLHDELGAQYLLNKPRERPPGRSEGYWATVDNAWLVAALMIARARGDFGAVAAALDTLPPLEGEGLERGSLEYRASLRAEALAHTGRFAEAYGALDTADRVFQSLGLDCNLCTTMRATVAALEGDAARADLLFAEASSAAPSLPSADLAWGSALLARGDPDAAILRLKVAAHRGPRFADPLEVWGEALLAKGEARAAARRFALAAKHAPRWGRLHLKWAQALAKSGKAEEARAHRQTAAALFITPAERAELAAMRL
jgi:tetratricopeptide (TPR) repeat protein